MRWLAAWTWIHGAVAVWAVMFLVYVFSLALVMLFGLPAGRSSVFDEWRVRFIRTGGILIVSGVLCGLAGAYLSIAHHASFIRDMSAGKGYLALAALIFGQWRPAPTLAACLLFAFADAAQARLQGTPLPLVGIVPVQLIQAIPYLLTVLLLAGFVGRAVAPRAIGVPYVKER